MRLFGGKTAEEVTHGIDGTGLTAIVTGASRGIGLQTTRVLALRGVHVVMAVRNMIAGNEAKDKLLLELPSAKIDVMELDLSSLASVRNFASQFTSTNRPLNLLINNAGVLASSFTLSHDNIELHFATNHLGHFLLTNLLLDTMKKTARTSGREGRIVNVSSMAHKFTYSEGIRFDKLNDPPGRQTYPQSKLANILHSNELTKRLKDEGVSVTANSVDPGSINTDLFRNSGIIRMIANVFFKGVQEGAATSCYVVLHQEVNGLSGKYFTGCKLTNPSRQAQDAVLAQRLWDFSMDLIK